jgi:hypothetical protein
MRTGALPKSTGSWGEQLMSDMIFFAFYLFQAGSRIYGGLIWSRNNDQILLLLSNIFFSHIMHQGQICLLHS